MPGRGVRARTRLAARRRHARRRGRRRAGWACRSSTTTTTSLWALGPATATGRALEHRGRRRPELIDRDGNPFRLSSLHGRKVLLVAWASY